MGQRFPQNGLFHNGVGFSIGLDLRIGISIA